MRVPLPQSTAISFARASAASGSRVARSGVSRVSRVPNANASTPAPRADDRVEVEEERPRVGVHRARDVAEDDELPRDGLARLPRLLDRLAAGAQRLPAKAAEVEPVAARVGRTAPRLAARSRPRDRGHEPSDALELLGRHLGEVLLPEKLVAGCAELVWRVGLDPPRRLRRLRLERVARDLVGEAARLLLTHERRNRTAQEPSDERPIEELELVVARDERLPKREVDVVLPREIDRAEPANGVLDAPRPDLDPDLAQHPPEGHDVPDDRASLHAATGFAVARASSMRPTSVSSRTVSMSSRYFRTEPSVCSTTSASISSRPSAASACAQSIVSATPGGFARSRRAQPANERGRLLRQPLRDPGNAQHHDLDLALDRRVPDPVEERAPLQRVVQLPGSVRGKDHRRLASRADGPELGDRDLEVREDLQQERLELLVGAVDLVDEEDDRPRPSRSPRAAAGG